MNNLGLCYVIDGIGFHNLIFDERSEITESMMLLKENPVKLNNNIGFIIEIKKSGMAKFSREGMLEMFTWHNILFANYDETLWVHERFIKKI